VTALLQEGGRVTGVRTRDNESNVSELTARVVVGADGRNSTIAKLVGARRYNVTENERGGAWAYYEGAEAVPRISFHQAGEDLFAWCPADSGLLLVIAIPTLSAFPAYRDSDGAGFDRAVGSYDPLASAIRGARRLKRPIFVARWQGYFRESAGPGWALVGDAGHFKDPTPGQGISDALRQAEHLADFIVAGLRERSPDEQLRSYWSWRDQDASETYWFAQDLGRGERTRPLVAEMFRRMAKDPSAQRAFYEVIHHRRLPSKVLTPDRLLGASARLLVRGSRPRRQILSETKGMIVLDMQRKHLNKRRQFEQGEPELQPGDDLLVRSTQANE
jgi:2-polyprenyl-6-methoxyphenol hydroxylase-like FAD-dependent oxidoreductase